MRTRRHVWLAAAVLLASASGAVGQPRSLALRASTYQTVRTPPFNGQLAFYAPDLRSSGKTVQLPLTIQILVGNGRRPFPTDAGTMAPREFEKYKTMLLATKAVRVIPFTIRKKGESQRFDYLSRSYVVVATDLVPCSGCSNRVVLTVEPAAR